MNKNESTQTLAMSGGYDSSSSSEDSFTPVEDLHVCPYDLEPMSSSDGEEVEEHVDPVYHHITVKNISSLSRNNMSRCNPWMEENKLHRYFKALARREDDLKMFPKAMRNFLSGEHPKIYESLLKLDNGEFFIYLGRSLVVTLNIENSRVRIPTSLIFDACVFSVNQPVVVISVFQENTNVSRMNMYNTFLARGVTEALRSYSCENVSVKKGATTVDCNVHEAVHKLQQESTEFENTSLFTMSKSKAENLVEALLRSTAVASTYLVINPKEDPDVVWFLNKEEFEFLMEFIDMTSLPVIHTIVGDRNLIALEMLTRLGKRQRTILLFSSIDAKLTRDHFEGHKNITVCEAPDEIVYCKNSIIITDHPLEAIKLPKGIRQPTIILVSNSKPDTSEKLSDESSQRAKIFSFMKETFLMLLLIHVSPLGMLPFTHTFTTSFHLTSLNESDKNVKDTSKKLSDKSSQTPQSFSFMEETSPMLRPIRPVGKLPYTHVYTTRYRLISLNESDIYVKEDDRPARLSAVLLGSSGYGDSSYCDEGDKLDFVSIRESDEPSSKSSDSTLSEMPEDYKLSTTSTVSHGTSGYRGRSLVKWIPNLTRFP